MKRVTQLYRFMSDRLQKEAEMANAILQGAHYGEYGRSAEQALRRLLDVYLPSSLEASTGFIFDGTHLSNQIDILVHDRAALPPFYVDDTFTVADGAAARLAIEVKTSLDAKEIDGILDAIVSAKASSPQVKTAVFAYAGTGIKLSTWKKHLKGRTNKGPDFVHVIGKYQLLLLNGRYQRCTINTDEDGEALAYFFSWILHSCIPGTPMFKHYDDLRKPRFTPI